MTDVSCKQARQELEDALNDLVQLAESLPRTSPQLEKKPPALREAIEKYNKMSANFTKCLEEQFKKTYGDFWE